MKKNKIIRVVINRNETMIFFHRGKKYTPDVRAYGVGSHRHYDPKYNGSIRRLTDSSLLRLYRIIDRYGYQFEVT